MRANRKSMLAAVFAVVAQFASAQTPTPYAGAGSTSPQQAPSGSPADVVAAPVAARPADTIGDAADRQRMARMLQSQTKGVPPSGAIPMQQAGGTVIGAINVERTQPQGLAVMPRPQQPDMALVEIARGPKATFVSIAVSGVERRVEEGDDLGNGWRVKNVGRFSVDLEESTSKSSGGGATGTKTKAAATKKRLKTRTLELKSTVVADVDMQRGAVPR